MATGLVALTRALANLGLTWLVQSTVLLALGLLGGRILRRMGPAVQSVVYRTTLTAIFVCPIASAALTALGVGGLSLELAGPAVAVAVASVPANLGAAPAQPASGLGSAEKAALPSMPEGSGENPALPFAADHALSTPAVLGTAPDVPSHGFSVGPAQIAAIALPIWLAGTAVLVIRMGIGQLRMRRLRASAVPAEASVEALCHDIARQMNVGSPTVWHSPFLFSPCLDGLRRPAILLPEDAGKNLRETFVHELAHLVRRDGLWNLLRRMATAGLWFHPMVWLLSRRLEFAAEEVCDDFVVQWGAERSHYAGHLLELATRMLPPVAPASVGMISLRSMLARRVVRILDTSRSLSIRAGRRAVAAMLAVGLALTLGAGLLGAGNRRATEVGDAKPKPAEKTIHGQVVGPDGKPIAGATVITWRAQWSPNGIGDDFNTRKAVDFQHTTTGSDGRYHFDFETPALAAQARLIATAAGFGLGYPENDHQIRLTAGDVPIEGRLVDLEGRPVAGVKVMLGQVVLPKTKAAKAAVTPKKTGEPVTTVPTASSTDVAPDNPFSMDGRLILDADGLLPGGVVTDADGRFRIAGLGRNVLANLTLESPTTALKKVRVVTRAMDRVNEPWSDPSTHGVNEPAIHGASCTIAVPPARPIEGFVRDALTKEPIPGAVVTVAILSGSGLSIDGLIATLSDARGHYRLTGLPKERAKGHVLAVYPPLDRPYFITRGIEAPAKPGFEPVQFDVALKRAIWITGKVTDVETGKPVSAAVDYFPLLTNPHAKEYPNFDPNITMSIAIKTRYKTDKDGRFRVVGLPGDGVVTAHTEAQSYLGGVGAESIKGRNERGQLPTYDRILPELYQSVKPVSVPEGANAFACDLAVDPGRSVVLRLVDQAGAPVEDTVVWGRNPEGNDHGDHGVYNQSEIRIGGLTAGKARTVMIQHHDRHIGALVSIPPDRPRDSSPMTVTLRPTATLTGRLLDRDGKPAQGGVQVELTHDAAARFGNYLVVTVGLDSMGRFRCDDVPGGGPYQVHAADRVEYFSGQRMGRGAFQPFVVSGNLRVESGQIFDCGTVDVSSGKRVSEARPKTSDRADVPIRGRIVDLEGQPVANVSVKVTSVMILKTDDLTGWLAGVRSGEPPWIASRYVDDDRKAADTAFRVTTTDKDGKFRLDGLGAERVIGLELKGETIAYTTIEVATRNMEPVPAPGFSNRHGPGTLTIHGADFTFSAAPSRAVEGIVKDSQTGQALADVEIRSYRFAGTNVLGHMILRTKTDLQGRFRLSGMPKGKGNMLIVVPNDDQPYLLQEVNVPDLPGAGAVPIELALKRGIWIEGKVTDKATGAAVPDARLHYLPFLANTYAQAHPVFHSSGFTDGLGYQDRYQTKADGTFRMVGLPGRAIVGAIAQDKAYRQGAGSEAIMGMNKAGHFETYNNPINPSKLWPTVMKEINPPADAKVVHVDLEFSTGPSVRLTVVDEAGQPVTGLKTNGRLGRSSYDRENTTKSDAEVMNLMPDEERIVLLRHEGRKLGKVVRIKQGDDASGPVVIKLAPLATITGRVTDTEGDPVIGAAIQPNALPAGDFALRLSQTATDSDGRFRVVDVPTGCDYGLRVETQATKAFRYAYHDKTAVKPGETTDVGEIQFKRD